MKKIILASLLVLATAMMAHAGIYRHDRKQSEYAALGAQPQFNCVGQLFHDGKFTGSCVLVGSRYVLSAAHCFVESEHRDDTIQQGNVTIVAHNVVNQRLGKAGSYSVSFNGAQYKCKVLTVYPGYLDTFTQMGLDIALMELDGDVKGVVPATLGTAMNELGKDVTGVGYGAYCAANKPEEIQNGPKKLAGENVVDSIGGYMVGGQLTCMFCDFDHPDSNNCNKMGSRVPRNLEYMCSGGDSGGGLFTKTAMGWELTGICHSTSFDVQQLIKMGYYGQVMSWTRVSVFAKWISANIYGNDSVALKAKWGSADKELSDILRFEGIEQYKLNLAGSKLKNKPIHLYYEEYTEGKITSKGALTPGIPDMLCSATQDTFQLKMMCQVIGDSTHVSFFYPRFTTSNYFQLKGPVADYSLRYLYSSKQETDTNIPAGKERQAVFVYSLPYQKPEEPNRKFYCELTMDSVPPAQWWERYHVKHYIVFYMEIG